jgi:hypothetical protein
MLSPYRAQIGFPKWEGAPSKSHRAHFPAVVGCQLALLGYANQYTELQDTELEENPGFLLWRTALRWQRLVTSALRPFNLTHVQFRRSVQQVEVSGPEPATSTMRP